MELWVWSPALHKQRVVVHTCNCCSAWGMEGGGPEVLGHPWLCSKFKTSLGYRKTNLAAYREDKFQNLRQPFPTCPYKTSGIPLMWVNPSVKSQHGFKLYLYPFHVLMSNSGKPCHVVSWSCWQSSSVGGSNRVPFESSALNESSMSHGFFKLLLQLFPFLSTY